jgi:predicted metal-dependent phosphoesterase TrpH
MKKKLKVDLHTHTAEDPLENIRYDSFQLIDRASQERFDVLAITNHKLVTYNQELAEYAEKKNILLIPGIEATFSDKEVLILNPGFKKNPSKRPLEDLGEIKNEHNLIIAPHPFFPNKKSLKSDLFSYLSFFDALEFSHFYNRYIDFNKPAVKTANQYNKPLLGMSDCHNIWQFGKTYTLVEAEKEMFSIFQAIRKGKIEIHTKPVSLMTMSRVSLNFFLAKRLKTSFRL